MGKIRMIAKIPTGNELNERKWKSEFRGRGGGEEEEEEQ